MQKLKAITEHGCRSHQGSRRTTRPPHQWVLRSPEYFTTSTTQAPLRCDFASRSRIDVRCQPGERRWHIAVEVCRVPNFDILNVKDLITGTSHQIQIGIEGGSSNGMIRWQSHDAFGRSEAERQMRHENSGDRPPTRSNATSGCLGA